jgi:hypothetical protein
MFSDDPEWQQIADKAASFVRALLAGHPGKILHPYASGVTVSFGGRPMLLTANHNLTRLEGRRLVMEVADDFVDLRLSWPVAQSVELDVAVYELPSAARNWGVPFLNLEAHLDRRPESDDTQLLVACGFPWKESEVLAGQQRVRLQPINHRSFEAPELYKRLRWDPQLFIASRFDRKKTVRDGERRAMKQPYGMSGGALWRFWYNPLQPLSLDRWSLAGILLEFHEESKKCMKSAKIQAVADVCQALIEGESG